MKHAYEIRVSFPQSAAPSAAEMLGQLHAFTRLLPALSTNLDGWMLSGNSLEEAKRYRAFDGDGVNADAARIESESFSAPDVIRIVQIWNGKEKDAGASIQYIWQPMPKLCVLTFTAKPAAFTANWKVIAELLVKVALLLKPALITVQSNGYWSKQVFKERPGVGWMLYLNKSITVAQVPEARALVRVADGDEQIGTVLVSEIDEEFSDANAHHVSVANSIEVRLADQDLLPR